MMILSLKIVFNCLSCCNIWSAAPSSGGKSTLVSALTKRGYRFIADELCLLSIQKNGCVYLHPGNPSIHLWKDAIDQENMECNNIERIRPDLQKYIVPIENQVCTKPRPLKQLILLAGSNKQNCIRLETLNMKQRLSAFLGQTYRQGYLKGMGLLPTNLQQCAQLSNHVPVQRLVRTFTHAHQENVLIFLENTWALQRADQHTECLTEI